jgi:hypothetical protein
MNLIDKASDPMREIAMEIYALGWRDAMKHLRKLALETSYNRPLFAPDDVTPNDTGNK